MPADFLHVSQMKGFVPPASERVNTPMAMHDAAERAAARAEKKEQSSSDAADHAEKETTE